MSNAELAIPTDNLSNKRKPWLAGLLSLMLPGLGQLYLGQPQKALTLFMVFSLLSVPGFVIPTLYLPSVLMLPVLSLTLILSFSIWLYAIVSAVTSAKNQSSYNVRTWQSPIVYIAVFIVCNLVLLPLIIINVRQHQVQPFYIPSGSMQPTLKQGDYMFADMRYNCPRPLCVSTVKHGDVAIFIYPNNRSRIYVKRIIGLPGDHIRIDGSKVFINDQLLSSVAASDSGNSESGVVVEKFDSREWLVSADSDSTQQLELTVPDGDVFVLGDNRGKSNDSRVYGTVPLSDVLGKVRQLWFSKSADGIRWGRIGKVID